MFLLMTPHLSLGRCLCDSLILNDDNSNVNVISVNDPSMCIYV